MTRSLPSKGILPRPLWISSSGEVSPTSLRTSPGRQAQIAYHSVAPGSAMSLGRCPHFQARRRGRSARVRLRGFSAGDAVAAEQAFFALTSTDQTAKYDQDVGRDCVNVSGTVDFASR